MPFKQNYLKELPYDNIVNYLETNCVLESFEINDNVLTTFISDT